MAYSTADGSVIIDVDMNISQAEKRLAKLRGDIEKEEKKAADATAARNVAQSKIENSQLDAERKKLEEMTASKKKLAEAESAHIPIAEEISRLESKLSEQQSDRLRMEEHIKKTQEAIISAQKELSFLQASPKDDVDYQKKISELSEFLHVAKPAIGNMQSNLAEYNAEIKRTSLELDRLKEKENSISLGAPQSVASDEAIKKQEEKIKTLKLEWDEAQKAVKKYNSEIAASNQKIDDLKTEAGILTQEIDEAVRKQNGFAKASDTADKAVARLGKRILGLASSALIFNVISRALTSIQQLTMKYIKTNAEARQAIAQLKGALLTLAQPLIEVIIPAFTLFVNILTKIISMAARLVSALFGKTTQQSKDGAAALYKEANAIGAVGEAAEEAAGSLAGFDEINTINTENAKSAGGVGSAGDEIFPDFDFTPGKYKDIIDELMVYLSGALLVIGAILLFSGANIPLGLGLMVLGAAMLAEEIAENWGAVDGKVRDAVNRMLIILGGALLVIGAILAFSGANIPLGIGLMVLGAAMLATAVALNWGSLDKEVRAALTAMMIIIGGFLIVLGVILAFSGVNIPLGIALILIGAASIAAAVGLNWDSLSSQLRSTLSEILLIIGTFLIVFGVLLILSGANIPLGFGLLIIGAAALASAAALDWDNVKSKITDILSELLLALSAALLVLGALLVFSGVNIPLGIALVVLGVAAMASGAALNWDNVKSKITDIITTLSGILGVAFLTLGAILTFSGANIPLGIALMVLGITGIGYAKLNWKSMEQTLKGPIGRVTAIASAAVLALGVILCFSGVGIPLGIALIAAGATGLVTVAVLNWNAIQEKLADTWEGIKSWWNQNVAKYLTLEYWRGLGKDIIDGFLGGLKSSWDSVTSWFNKAWNGLFGNREVSVEVNHSGNFGSTSSGGFGGRMSAIPEISEYNIPALAQGAVIPPNRKFLAVLGDQRSGTNVEAPADLIRQMVIEGIQAAGMSGGNSQPIQVNVMLDKRVLARAMVNEVNDMTRQAGEPVLLF